MVVAILPAGIAISWVSAATPGTRNHLAKSLRAYWWPLGRDNLSCPTEHRPPSRLISRSLFGEGNARWWHIRMMAVLAAPRGPGPGRPVVPILQAEITISWVSAVTPITQNHPAEPFRAY